MSDDYAANEEFAADFSGGQRRRFVEPLKMIPVLFVLGIISILYCIYMKFHCLHLLQVGVDPARVDEQLRREGVMHCCIFNGITLMLLTCYARSMLTHPGEVPDDETWQYVPMDGASLPGAAAAPALAETKRSGERRHCKWCGIYKPDRCHHCRVCRTCILKMDHHCPWIYNCVGYKNYKFFFLLLFYSLLDLHYIIWTMGPSMVRSLQDDHSFQRMFFLLFGATLASFLAFFVTMFWIFHVWLIANAMTTIEFCEKSLPKKGGAPAENKYNLGLVRNFQEALGSNPLLALFPLAPPEGGGGLVYELANEEPTLSAKTKKGRERRVPGGYGAYGSSDESIGMGATLPGSYGSVARAPLRPL